MTKIVVGFVVIVLIMLAIPILLAWSGSRRRLRVPRVGGVVVLRMPRGHNLILAMLAFLPFAAISGLAFAVTWKPGNEVNGWILGSVMAVAAVTASGYLVLLELRGCVKLDDQAIEKVGALTNRRAAWGEVEKLTFNTVNHWFFFTFRGCRRVYVTEAVDGICDFAEVVLRKVPPAILSASPDTLEALQELAGMK